jgi:capsular exopolysaccharide synthesis family protein
LNRQLAQAQGERIQLEGYLSSTSDKNRKSLPQLRDNVVTQTLSRELAEAETELSQASVNYGDQHPKVQSLKSKVDELKKQLSSQEQGTVDQLQTTYSAARSREQLLIARMRDITSDMSRVAQYNSLKKEAQTNSELYNALYARVKEAAIAAASRSANIRVVDSARILDRPTKPRRVLNLAIGLVLSLLCGIVVSFTKEALDPTLQDSVDIYKCTGLHALSIVPRFSSDNKKLGPRQKLQLDRPNSPEAEAVRVLYTGLMLSPSTSGVRTILVTSSAPGDGKTTIAVNLAMTLARQGTTCLFDGDLRGKSTSASFGIRDNRGVAEVIAGEATLSDVLVDMPEISGLSILPAGDAVENAGEVVLSSGMREVISDLRSRFQYVVLDSPPILTYADGRALASVSDGVILVARYGVTTREILHNSAEALRKAGVNIFGVVLNGADFRAPGYGKYGYSDYGNRGRSA